MKKFEITENGNLMTITETERDILMRIGAIYHCPDCGEVFYHVVGDKLSLEEIDELLTQHQTVTNILDRKRNGQDCTEEESAELKMWIKETLLAFHDGTAEIEAMICALFPNEYGEAIDERENLT